jgi:hypothetical protein
MLEFIIAIIISGVISSAIHGWLFIRRRRIESQKFYRDKYYELAHKIIADPELDDTELERIKVRTLELDNPRTFRALMKAIDQVDEEVTRGSFKPMHIPPMAEQLCADWVAMIHSYIVAVSYYRPLQGMVLRATLARVLDPSAIVRSAEMIDRHIHPLKVPPRYAHASM